jgi:hypothetical protein
MRYLRKAVGNGIPEWELIDRGWSPRELVQKTETTSSVDCHRRHLWIEATIGSNPAKKELREEDGPFFGCR